MQFKSLLLCSAVYTPLIFSFVFGGGLKVKWKREYRFYPFHTCSSMTITRFNLFQTTRARQTNRRIVSINQWHICLFHELCDSKNIYEINHKNCSSHIVRGTNKCFTGKAIGFSTVLVNDCWT